MCGQRRDGLLEKISFMLATMRTVNSYALFGLLCGGVSLAAAQPALLPQGAEYVVPGPLSGDQVKPQLAASQSGGVLVWQDGVIDGDGAGIGAVRLDRNFSPVMAPFLVNSLVAGDQENPRAALLANGGVVFVWQGGVNGFTRIYARFLNSSFTFAGPEVQVNTYTKEHQQDPAVAGLADGSVLVVWSSYGQDGEMQGIFGRKFSAAGVPLGSEFQVNQFTDFNQKTPAIAKLSNGNVVIAWASEQQRKPQTVDIYGRIFSPAGTPLGSEFQVNSIDTVCANPGLTALPQGGFVAVWGQKDGDESTRSWDIFARAFGNEGQPVGEVALVNTTTYGDQIGAQITAGATKALVVWTSLLQDGSWEGVYGRTLDFSALPIGDEFRVNTTTVGKQMEPAVASDGVDRFLAVWTGYVAGAINFDLFGQQYSTGAAVELAKPGTPFVSVVGPNNLSVTWAPMTGLNLDHYEVFMDDGTQPVRVSKNLLNWGGLNPGTTHRFKVLYQLADGRRSPVSDSSSATTWGMVRNDGIPFEWLVQYYGNDPAKWPDAKADTDGDGASTLDEFLAGTSPKDAASSLKTTLAETSQGWKLGWNTQPGSVYQVQTSTDFQGWAALGDLRFAVGTQDSVAVDNHDGTAYYRVVRLR